MFARAAASAQTPVSSVRAIDALPGSTLTIRGSTTVGAKWHCTARDVDARVAMIADAPDTSSLPDVRGVVVTVPVSRLRCQSGPMERAMLHALKADVDTAARTIAGRFEIFEEGGPRRVGEVALIGGLRVAAVDRLVFLAARVTREDEGTLRVQSTVPLTLSAFAIVAPRVLFGAIRARDAISVDVDLRFP